MIKTIKMSHIRFGSIRFMEENNSKLFIARDILRALEYTNPEMALAKWCKYAKVKEVGLPDGKEKETFIPESDVYRLISHSYSPEAKRFRNWLEETLYPSETLEYNEENFPLSSLEDILTNPDIIIGLANRLKKEQTDRSQVERINRENYPRVLFSSAVEASKRSILVGELAKILRQNGVKIGQNRLFQWLRDNKYLGKSGERYNYPTQRSMEMGLFELKKTTITKPDGSVLVTTTPKVTGKGQIYFLQKIITAC